MEPESVGLIVHYRLSAQDAMEINRRREDFMAFTRKHTTLGSGLPVPPGELGRSGHIGHFGNTAREGDLCPAMIVRVFVPNCAFVNLQVFLDGNDTYWVGSRTEGDEPGHWSFR